MIVYYQYEGIPTTVNMDLVFSMYLDEETKEINFIQNIKDDGGLNAVLYKNDDLKFLRKTFSKLNQKWAEKEKYFDIEKEYISYLKGE